MLPGCSDLDSTSFCHSVSRFILIRQYLSPLGHVRV